MPDEYLNEEARIWVENNQNKAYIESQKDEIQKELPCDIYDKKEVEVRSY